MTNAAKRNPPAAGGNEYIVALAGNPNVGKSTLFNTLTGLRQHTGNWSGKTVELAWGMLRHGRENVCLVDLPGTYSLDARSPEEEETRDFLFSGKADAVIVVCDATCLERNLKLALQILAIADNVILCLNLMDEARRKEIRIDTDQLSAMLDTEVICTSARNRETVRPLIGALERTLEKRTVPRKSENRTEASEPIDRRIRQISDRVISFDDPDCDRLDRRIDRILTGRKLGIPLMMLLLAGVLWITIVGADLPSRLLMRELFRLGDAFSSVLTRWETPGWLHDALILGVWRMLAWVISVMLPPMAIFFPLFTLLEDVGYLPRLAFNLDNSFQKCRACGKQALTTCMGFGCNAAAVVGCRIIDSPRERLLAITTNSFVPCNGRFPILICLLTIFGAAKHSLISALLLAALILAGILLSLGVTKLLSQTLLKGEVSFFTLELPPYRRPQIGQVLIRSLLDRTLFVLGRAAAVAAPAGLLIWILANSGGEVSFLQRIAVFLDPPGRAVGMDGPILLAFLLGWPANETVIPILLMIYLSGGSLVGGVSVEQIGTILSANGWSWSTALCVMLFTLMHWPCTTTLLTIYRETRSLKWTTLSALIPTILGASICWLCNTAIVFLRSVQ